MIHQPEQLIPTWRVFLIKQFQGMINIIVSQICGNRGKLTAMTGATSQNQQKKGKHKPVQTAPFLADWVHLKVNPKNQ